MRNIVSMNRVESIYQGSMIVNREDFLVDDEYFFDMQCAVTPEAYDVYHVKDSKPRGYLGYLKLRDGKLKFMPAKTESVYTVFNYKTPLVGSFGSDDARHEGINKFLDWLEANPRI